MVKGKNSHLVVPWTFTFTKKQFEYNSSRTLIPCHKCHNDLGAHFGENKAGKGQNKRKLSDARGHLRRFSVASCCTQKIKHLEPFFQKLN